jgi:uncharacterized protein (TIGR04255 family)
VPHRDLKNKPLVEAALEIQWQLHGQGTGVIKADPHYKMLLGRFYERLMDTYPIHETLPAAALPESMAAYSPQHLFRVGPAQWPAVQIGPGILSVHERDEYSWKDFVWRCVETASKLVDAYPRPAELKVELLRLRYLDAVAFDFTQENLLDFLRDKFKSTAQLPSDLFQDRHVQPQPISFSWQASFREDTPPGTISVRFSTGERQAKPAILWETVVESVGKEVPQIPRDFQTWLQEAHELSSDWFFKLIAGELEKNFAGE